MKIVSAQVTDQSDQATLGLSDLPLPLGRSEAMRRVHDQIRRLASADTTTLIYGETGTDEELVAAALHRLSRRGSEPYICTNCGGLPDGLVESELFGHVRGAFTGAFQERTGRFEAAHGGTLFLDEIGDTSPATQIRLLRILDQVRGTGRQPSGAQGRCTHPCRNEQTPLRRSRRRTISQGPLLNGRGDR